MQAFVACCMQTWPQRMLYAFDDIPTPSKYAVARDFDYDRLLIDVLTSAGKWLV